MTGGLVAAGVVIGAGDIGLLVACWCRRSVLGGVLGAVGILLIAFALTRAGSKIATAQDVLLIAALSLLIGAALLMLGQVMQRLLDDGPDEPGSG